GCQEISCAKLRKPSLEPVLSGWNCRLFDDHVSSSPYLGVAWKALRRSSHNSDIPCHFLSCYRDKYHKDHKSPPARRVGNTTRDVARTTPAKRLSRLWDSRYESGVVLS